MSTATQHRERLLEILARLSFRFGDFTLASDAKSDYYIDCRITTLHAEGGRLAGLVMYDLLRQHGLQVDAAGGLTMGADPLVSNLANASAFHAWEYPGSPLIHGFLVRKAEKTHGTGRRIEGFCQPGARVAILDDVCTTGGSTITAIEAAREAGMTVDAVLCLVDREQGGRAAIEAVAENAPFLSVFTANEVGAAHLNVRSS